MGNDMNDDGRETLRAGTAKIVITPDYPVPLAGFYDRMGPFEGVHDDLFARAVDFESKGIEAVIIAVDICLMPEAFCDDVADRIERDCGIPAGNILINASHTHGGPALWFQSEKTVMDPSFLDNNPYIDDQKRYAEELAEKLVSVVREAHDNLIPARIGYGKGETFIGVNRREKTLSGDIAIGVNPEGAVDRELAVIRVDNENGRPLAVMFNTGVHGVSMMSREITGDWCGLAAQAIEEKLGRGIVAPFLSGAAGNVNTIYVAKTDFSDPDGTATDLAQTVSEEVLHVCETIDASDGGPVMADRRDVTLPGKRYLGLIGFDPGYDDLAKDTSPVPDSVIRLSALRVGPVVFGASSAETFNEIGVAFKKRSPFPGTVFLGITNGYSSYVLTDDEMERGGYEYNATIVASGGESAIVGNLLDMVREFAKQDDLKSQTDY